MAEENVKKIRKSNNLIFSLYLGLLLILYVFMWFEQIVPVRVTGSILGD